jgi:hypothetical protein
MDPLLRLPLMLLFLIQAWGAEGEVDLLGRILAAQAGHTTAVGVFERSIRQAELPDMEPQRFTVQLWVEAPDHYHLRYTQAGDAEGVYTAFVSDGQTRWQVEIWDPEEPAEIQAKPAAEGEGMARIKDFIPLRRESLERDFELRAEAVSDGARLHLQPKEADLRKHVTGIEIDFDAQFEIRGLHIHFSEGNLETWSTREISHPETIEPARFRVE